MNISLINAESVLGPLCRSYVCASFEALQIHVSSVTGVRAAHLLWAVGILSHHRPHFLGIWYAHEPKDAGWRAIARDLQDRGIERLRIVIGPDPGEIEAAMAPHYREAVVLPSSAAVAHPELASALSGHRQYVERALSVAGSLSPRLKRAASRYGPFADPTAASALLRQSAERCISRNVPERFEPVRMRPSPTGVAPTAAAS